jgi:uncharacterized protein with ParB-like and HNH nuclease domain
MNNSKDSIRKFVNYLNNPIEDGGYWLPNIQRSFVWKEEQIERLFDSILREYPIGTLLIWKTRSSLKRRKFIDLYKETIKLTDYYIPVDDTHKMLVLDGQQRLQSLFIGLKGSYDKKELYFDVFSGDLVAPEDMRFKFEFLDGNSLDPKWIKFKDIVFSDKRTREIKEDVYSRFTNLTKDKKDRIDDNIDAIRETFITQENLLYQVVDSVDRPNAYGEDDIVEIFIRANAGGTQLGKSDLLFSLLTSSWEEADEEMDILLEAINKTGYKFNRDFILKTCLSIFDKGATYNVQKFRDSSTRQNIIDNWDKISSAIKDVKDFIYGNTFSKTDNTLPSYLSLIPVIYFRYRFQNEWNEVKHLDTYLLRTLLSGAFSGNPDSLIDKCTRLISENKKFNINEIFEIIRADGRNLEITKDTILSIQYTSKEIHLLFNYWYGFNYQPAYINNQPQIDHIFPQSVLQKIKDTNPNTGRMDILRYKSWERNQFANLMLLTASENGAGGKSDTLPRDWFNGKTDDYLENHLIPKDNNLWEIDKFDDFINERKKLIEEKFKDILLETTAKQIYA